MASSKLLFFLISPFFFHFLAPGTIAQLEWQYGLCYPNGNYTINSTYESNLNHVLNSLTSDTSIDYGFYKSSYGENEDKAYAFGLCRPDMEPDTCRNCINEASNNITSICPKYLIAIAGFDDRGYNNCMLRYADYDIFGVMETQPYFFVHSEINITENLVEFNQTRNRLLERLISAAAARGSPHKYAVGEEPVKNILSLYALVQCNPYLSEDDCIRCLNDTTKLIPECCDKREGGRVITPSCNFRYATSKFYKASIEGPPVVSPTPPTRPSVVSPTLSTRPPVVSPTPPTNQKGKKNCTVIIVICSVVGSVLLIIFIGSNIFLRMRKREEEYENVEDIKNRESLQFNFSTIRDATDNFSDTNKLGQGGFGAVYKGMLSDGQQIAVKRLAMNSKQGDLEFKNEVLLVAKLQHRNLVRLLGFCLERKERILVYEFLPNSSLDRIIFDPDKREFLDWEKCYKIIRAIARGLLYLHEDSRLRIVHRDLKTSNILLDSELNPKILDFGMARLFKMDQTQSSTNRVVGTFGYMIPEYIMHGRISVKSNVYSFGTLVLEIMSGQKISSFGTEEESEGLLTYAWKNWNDGTASNLIDPSLRDGSTDEMMKCIHIGLLCVQENVSDRPTMASVVVMLSSEILTLSAPSKPGFFKQNSIIREASSSKEHHSGSRNEVSITELYPR
ncbi:hypothetical protein ACOSQ2_012623 [Xanthoceras sorbifolium]